MRVELFLWGENIIPGRSSHTTSSWPLSRPVEEDTMIVVDSVSLDGGNLHIQPPREKGWDEIAEEVLHDRQELWRELANL